MKQMLFAILALLFVSADAQVYQWTDPDGKVHFSDRPGPDAEPVEVKPVQTISAPPAPQTGGATPPDARYPADQDKTVVAYTAFTIVSPTAEQEVRANDGNVMVRLSLRPALASGHVIWLTVTGEGGEQRVSANAVGVTLGNLSRGRHTVSAKVMDDKGHELIAANPVSFNVLRAAAARKSPR